MKNLILGGIILLLSACSNNAPEQSLLLNNNVNPSVEKNNQNREDIITLELPQMNVEEQEEKCILTIENFKLLTDPVTWFINNKPVFQNNSRYILVRVPGQDYTLKITQGSHDPEPFILKLPVYKSVVTNPKPILIISEIKNTPQVTITLTNADELKGTIQWWLDGKEIGVSGNSYSFTRDDKTHTIRVQCDGGSTEEIIPLYKEPVIITLTSVLPKIKILQSNTDPQATILLTNAKELKGAIKWWLDGTEIVVSGNSYPFIRDDKTHTIRIQCDDGSTQETIAPYKNKIIPLKKPKIKILPHNTDPQQITIVLENASDLTGSVQWLLDGTVILVTNNSYPFTKDDKTHTIRVINSSDGQKEISEEIIPLYKKKIVTPVKKAPKIVVTPDNNGRQVTITLLNSTELQGAIKWLLDGNEIVVSGNSYPFTRDGQTHTIEVQCDGVSDQKIIDLYKVKAKIAITDVNQYASHLEINVQISNKRELKRPFKWYLDGEVINETRTSHTFLITDSSPHRVQIEDSSGVFSEELLLSSIDHEENGSSWSIAKKEQLLKSLEEFSIASNDSPLLNCILRKINEAAKNLIPDQYFERKVSYKEFSFEDLQSVKRLWLDVGSCRDNQVYLEDIPNFILQLPSLKELRLGSVKSFPESWQELGRSLKSLTFTGSQLPIEEWKKLNTLKLEDLTIRDVSTFPDFVMEESKLQRNLKTLNLSDVLAKNNFNLNVRNLRLLTQLETLTLRDVKKFENLSEFPSFPNLETLTLSGGNLFSLPAAVLNNTSLNQLLISAYPDFMPPADWGILPKYLARLALVDLKITSFPKGLTSFQNLKQLDLRSNPLKSSSFPADWGNLSQSLEEFFIDKRFHESIQNYFKPNVVQE